MANPLTFGFEKTKTRKKMKSQKKCQNIANPLILLCKWLDLAGFCYVNCWIFSGFLIGPGGLPPHKIFRRSSFSGAERVRGSTFFVVRGRPGGEGVEFRRFTPHVISMKT